MRVPSWSLCLWLSCWIHVSFSFSNAPPLLQLLRFPGPISSLPTSAAAVSVSLASGTTGSVLPETTTTTTTTTKKQQQTEHVYLFSLKWTPDDRISKPCRDLWKWKDATLGDGRDFFVPKPKTIAALQHYLIRHHDGKRISQVSILSNCARLEIICVVDVVDDSSTKDYNPIAEISRFLMDQVRSAKQRPPSSSLMSVLTQSMDVPEWVLDSSSSSSRSSQPDYNNDDAKELERHWEIRKGTRDILNHLCLVAAGMASRPRRPERETIFRPFSSRDAHILLQLKRTKETAQGRKVQQLLEYALRAGKAARNINVVPELKRLQEYGTGDDSKYSMEPPREMLLQVSKAVMEQAIQPLVQEYMEVSGITDEISVAISLLRKKALELANNNNNNNNNPTERGWIQKRLHQPTMDLRQGKLRAENVAIELDNIEKEFLSFAGDYKYGNGSMGLKNSD